MKCSAGRRTWKEVISGVNYIWIGMILLGAVFAAANGTLNEFNEGFMGGCERAVQFAIGLSGIMAVWSGIMNVARQSGLMQKMSEAAAPLMKFLFPKEKNPEILSAMLMSFAANLFGAGNSATVFSLKAMTLLDEENGKRDTASDSMCMFLAISMGMLQLIPITVLKIRRDAGSVFAESIIIPSILAGVITTVAAVVLCRWFERRR